jgi:Raf kinase inhibitor-like YbhB/YbcL family protein
MRALYMFAKLPGTDANMFASVPGSFARSARPDEGVVTRVTDVDVPDHPSMGGDTTIRERIRTRRPGVLELTSSAFGHGQRIPVDYTHDGMNVSPDLAWSRAPERTRSFALICDDPDAPTAEPFVHWVIFDIPSDQRRMPRLELPEGVSKEAKPPEVAGAVQGTNDFGHFGYDGPSPPPGHGTHHYHFSLYALDRILDLQAGCRKADVLRAMKGHVLAQGELIGIYSR